MTDTLHLDYETKCDLDIKQVGLDRYTSHPSFAVMMAAYRINKDPFEQWQAHVSRVPSDLKDALRDPKVLKWGFNSQFERVSTERGLKIETPPESWRCSMVLAYMQSFTGSLAEVGEQIGLPQDKQKKKDGARLIRMFTMPQRITKNFPYEWRNWRTDPDDWQEFADYNVQDLISEEAIESRLIRYPILEDEWRFYHLDQRINDAGMPLDLKFVENVIWMSERRKNELLDQMAEITGLRNPNSVSQLLPWLQVNGYPYDDLTKESVEKALNRADRKYLLSEACITVLEHRQWSSRTSTSKAVAAQRTVGEGDRVRFMYQFAGAGRTNRFAGRNVQPQNMMKTPKLLDPEESDEKLAYATELIRKGDYDGFELFLNEPMLAFAGCMRGMFRAPEGYEFKVMDYSSVESAGLAWLADCPKLLKIFREGLDPYKYFGTLLYRKPYDQITPTERNICKPPMLGCLGADTLVLTDNGWQKITDIRELDLVFDGLEFVHHSGAVDQGLKQTILFHGLSITSDHKILCGDDGWRSAEDVFQNTRLGRKAIDLATGGLSSLYERKREPFITDASVTVAEKLTTFMHKIWSVGKRKVASLVPTNAFEKRKTEFIYDTRSVAASLIDWQIDITQSCLGAGVAVTLRTDTRVAVSSVSLPMFTALSGIASRWKVLATRACGLIESITTAITRQGTFGLLPTSRAQETKNICAGLPTEARRCVRPSFGNGLLLFTKIRAPWLEKLGKGCRRNKSFRIRPTVKVRTYDILDCGPLNRFMVWTDAGPIVVHNCGYRLSAGELKDGVKTGLLKYAEAMGIDLTPDQSKLGVNTFRTEFPEVPENCWYAYERAIRHVLTTHTPMTVRHIRFEWMKPYLLIRLPSGRYIYYYKPRLEQRVVNTGRTKVIRSHGMAIHGAPEGVQIEVPDTYVKTVFTYMGRNQRTTQWDRIDGHGGVTTENIDQALCRDILKVGLTRLHADGWQIVGHSHDEAICLTKIGDNYYTLDRMRDLFAQPIEWAPGFPLKASGYQAQFYRK